MDIGETLFLLQLRGEYRCTYFLEDSQVCKEAGGRGLQTQGESFVTSWGAHSLNLINYG